MNDDRVFLYDKLPVEMLAGFYFQINTNIEKENLSNAMHHEISLIKEAAKRKNISLTCLYNQGSLMK